MGLSGLTRRQLLKHASVLVAGSGALSSTAYAAENPPIDQHAFAGGLEQFNRPSTIASASTNSIEHTTFSDTAPCAPDYTNCVMLPSVSVPSPDLSNVRLHGAMGDGVTDDTAALQAAADAAFTSGLPLYIPPSRYLTSATVTLRSDTVATGAEIIAAHDGLALQVGVQDTLLRSAIVWLPHVTKQKKTWGGTDVGVRVVNAYECEIHVARIRNFSVGLDVTARGGRGCVYNTAYIRHLDNNKINLRVQPTDDTSWVNENLFMGGRYSHGNEGISVAGVRQILIGSAAFQPNNNVWMKPSIEGDVPEYHVECYGLQNTIYNARWEAATPKVLFNELSNSNFAQGNQIIYGYDAHRIVATESPNSRYNHVQSRNRMFVSGTGGPTGLFQLSNGSSNADPALVVLEATARLATDASTAYQVALAASDSRFKGSADRGPRLTINHNSGSVTWGNGAGGAIGTINQKGSIGLQTDKPFSVGTVMKLPSAQAAYRGCFVRVEGAAGVADALYICEKNASDGYIWRQI